VAYRGVHGGTFQSLILFHAAGALRHTRRRLQVSSLGLDAVSRVLWVWEAVRGALWRRSPFLARPPRQGHRFPCCRYQNCLLCVWSLLF
jgi:hypothetical protein